ncbi:Na+/H+ antiporter NhaC family protein [Dorea acetigenes]|jgi:Na+/H+ antiporter NhaC|uniref:Na+/H+ antiporter NhaC family protein n=1 Tax=Dorea acetigenes TaxID=2981787 RepID=A0ABT2RNQ8_9FIRM|nr:Na+/H+ antiporter NhaC family protein [Dorea acetigenes]MCB6416219.1 Na+/H+ antiporter NhaC family protein [Faecalimonas umbilicata]MCU6686998.1 Na+/H+ antiporter NhaC family protein [Dorea acetigenes]SCJ21601.1 Malate-2H(+)/Na(+)-lactate antiporter [uncultured Clostridium sp.]
MGNERKKGRAIALLPIGVFLIIFLGSGIVTGDFYAMPAIVAFLIALCVAFLQNRSVSFEEKISIIAKGVGDENIITMSLIFLCAGGFSGAVTAAGGVESTVNLGLSILPSHVAVVGLFVIGCFISVSMGTSMGTIAALAPIAVGISEKTGFALPICIGAVVCGAMFGDNLSMISDTTIAAVKTQGCEMKDKFRENFFIVLPAAVITVLIFFFITRNGGNYTEASELTWNFWKVLPYLLVLIGALVGINVFVVLIGGTILSLIVGVATGSIALNQMFLAVGGGEINGTSVGGVTGMYDITVISIIVACIVSLVKEYGGIQFVLDLIRRKINSQRGAELGIAGLSLLVDACTANNTVAIVMAGPIAKEISDEYKVDPKRTASLLDIFTSVGQGMIPYGAQLLSAASLTGLTPFNILPYLFYPVLMAISAVLFILFRRRK